MADQYLYLDAQFVKAEIAKLIEAYPELAGDETLRADMIEAETNAKRIIERAMEERQYAEMMAGAIKARIADMSARHGRFARKSEAMKLLARNVMKAANLRSLELTEVTLSVTKARKRVNILDLDALPQGFYAVERKAKATEIKAALEAGEEIPGAELVTGDDGLMIRPK